MSKHENSQKQSDDVFDICKVNSAADCTGLIPAAIQDEAELDSYKALYEFQPPKTKVNKDTSESKPHTP